MGKLIQNVSGRMHELQIVLMYIVSIKECLQLSTYPWWVDTSQRFDYVIALSRDRPCGQHGWSRGLLPFTPGFRQRAEPIFQWL